MAQPFSKYDLGLLVLETLSGVHEVKTIFIICRHFFCHIHCVDIYTEGVKAVDRKTAGTLAQIKTEAQNCIVYYASMHL